MYDELRYLRQLFWKILSTHPQNTRWTSDKLSGKYCYQIQDPRIHVQYCSTVYPLSSQLVLQIYVKKVKLHPNFNPNIFSEIIELQQNGASGGNLTQILISHWDRSTVQCQCQCQTDKSAWPRCVHDKSMLFTYPIDLQQFIYHNCVKILIQIQNLPKRRPSHTCYICVAFLHCVFSNVSSNWLHLLVSIFTLVSFV